MLDNKTKERITQAAKNPNPKFWGNDYEHDAFEKGYIAGAEAEAERAQGLAEALKAIEFNALLNINKMVLNNEQCGTDVLNALLGFATTALTNYNNPK